MSCGFKPSIWKYTIHQMSSIGHVLSETFKHRLSIGNVSTSKAGGTLRIAHKGMATANAQAEVKCNGKKKLPKFLLKMAREEDSTTSAGKIFQNLQIRKEKKFRLHSRRLY